MKKLILTIFIGIFVSLQIFAKPITIEDAKKVAKNFLYENESITQNDLKFSDAIIFKEQSNLFYIFNFKNRTGFIIISATDNYTPIIAYSTESYYDKEKQAPQFVELMKDYAKQVEFTIKQDIKANETVKPQWEKYNCSPQNFKPNKDTKSVSALLDPIAWDQGSGWNGQCPLASGGPGGHAYAGCVATAQGQAMKYWEHPPRGIGSHSYWENDNGILTVDFMNETYNWASMPDAYSSYETAKLLYHCGVSVDMNYEADGSGAYTYNCVTSLESYFRYKQTAEYVEKANYTDAQWMSLLKNELDNSRVMIYSGHSTSGGHAFNCDGYNNSDYFHFNFGWNGYDNGYYSLSYVNGFNEDQGAVIGIEPDYNYIPENLTATVNSNDVTLDWEILASSNKDLTGFYIFRDDVQIGDLIPAGTFTYTDSDLDNGSYSYCVKAVYGTDVTDCSNSESVNINYTGITNNSAKIKIFPNPASDYIKISLSQTQKYELQVIDVCGKTLINKTGTDNKLTVNVSKFAKGIYIINVTVDNTTVTKKIILE